jgi:hypothetical protein
MGSTQGQPAVPYRVDRAPHGAFAVRCLGPRHLELRGQLRHLAPQLRFGPRRISPRRIQVRMLGTDGQCSPRQETNCEPSILELNTIV